MNVFNPLKDKDEFKDKLEQNVKQEAQHTILWKSFRLKNGHKVWKLNVSTGQIEETDDEDYERVDVDWNDIVGSDGKIRPDYHIHRKIKRSENCVYCSALNLKNAKKVFRRDYDYRGTFRYKFSKN